MRYVVHSVAAVAAVAAMTGAWAADASQGTAAAHWKISYTIHTAPAPISSSFSGTLALSSHDAWAVGNISSVTGPAVRRPAVRRWNGTSWAAVALPKTYRTAYLYEIAGSSPANVWVFGQWQNSHGADTHAFALRWNGSWSRTGWWATSGDISGAVVLGPRDVWIFGGAGTRHYDGKCWRSSRLPYTLNRASAITGNDIWAVSTTSGKPVLARWHDRRWSSQRLPAKILADQVTLTDVAATPAGDIWVVGGWFNSSKGQFVPVALEWARGRWRQVPVPGNVEPGRVIYDGLGGLWMSYFKPQNAVTAMLHYTAGKWQTVRLPQVSGKQTLPIPLARVPGSPTIFAAGGLWVLGGFPYSVAVILEYGR